MVCAWAPNLCLPQARRAQALAACKPCRLLLALVLGFADCHLEVALDPQQRCFNRPPRRGGQVVAGVSFGCAGEVEPAVCGVLCAVCCVLGGEACTHGDALRSRALARCRRRSRHTPQHPQHAQGPNRLVGTVSGGLLFVCPSMSFSRTQRPRAAQR